MTSLHETHRQDISETWVGVTATIQFLSKHLDSSSPEYQKIFREETRPYRKLIEAKALPNKLDREIAIKVYVKAALKGWRTVKIDDEGQAVPVRDEINTKGDEWLAYTPENAIEVLKRYPRLFKDATEASSDLENYQVSEDEAKNSESA